MPAMEALAPCEVLSIHDADTLTARIDLGWGVSLTDQIRFLDFDAWEITRQRRTVVYDKDEIEKGKKAKAALEELLKDRQVYCLRTGQREVYGRVLTKLYVFDKANKLIDVSLYMKEHGHDRR